MNQSKVVARFRIPAVPGFSIEVKREGEDGIQKIEEMLREQKVKFTLEFPQVN